MLALCACLTFAVVGCQRPSAAPPAVPTALPPAAPAAKVAWAGTYSANVQPIFDQRCVSCHGPAKAENGLRLDSYEGVMKGTQFGPIVVPGQPFQSALVSVVQGTGGPGSAGVLMPHGGTRLNDQDVQNIILWIQAGAPKN